MQHPAVAALTRWMARNQRIGELVMKVAAPHGARMLAEGPHCTGPPALMFDQDEVVSGLAAGPAGGTGGTGGTGLPGPKPGPSIGVSGICTSRVIRLRCRMTSTLSFSCG